VRFLNPSTAAGMPFQRAPARSNPDKLTGTAPIPDRVQRFVEHRRRSGVVVPGPRLGAVLVLVNARDHHPITRHHAIVDAMVTPRAAMRPFR